MSRTTDDALSDALAAHLQAEEVIGEWDPSDLDDASEAVVTALESAGLVPTIEAT